MNEQIYRQARFQFFLLWAISASIPLIFTGLWEFLVPAESSMSLPIWAAAIVGVLLGVGVHFWLRKALPRVSLVGTAIYTMYQRERKMELAERRQRAQQTGPVA